MINVVDQEANQETQSSFILFAFQVRPSICTMTSHALLLEYLSAYNNHDSNKIISFLHPDCRVLFNGQVWKQGIEAIRPTYEQEFLNPQTNATLVECTQDENDADRIRALLKTNDNRLIDVTYVFETKKNQDEVNNKKMIEHIIHSVKPQ
jgi:hypothetical protein